MFGTITALYSLLMTTKGLDSWYNLGVKSQAKRMSYCVVFNVSADICVSLLPVD